MLHMGVTMVVGGNYGDNRCNPADYLDIVDQNGTAVNVVCSLDTPISVGMIV
jgi:hypothetical protein